MTNQNVSAKAKIFRFKNWSRQKFGVFNSLKKTIIITNMVLAISCVFEHKTAEAQVDTTSVNKTIEIDEVVITGERNPVDYSRLARVVTIINSDEIAQLPVQDVSGLLEYVLNLDIRQRGVHGVQADISMRGGTFDQTLVLLNGINISDPQTGHHNLNLPLDLSAVHRIEILEGPAARVFGANAFNGAINIITNPDKESGVQLSATAGQYGFVDGAASAAFTTGDFRHFMAASHKQSDGYLDDEELNNTDFENTSIFYHGRLKALSGQFDVQGGYDTKGFGANSFYTPAYPNQYEATRTLFASAGYMLKHKKWSLIPKIYYRRNHDRFELFRDNPASWYTTHNYHMTDIWGANVATTYQLGFGSLALGVDYRDEHIYSNVLGLEMDEPKDVPCEDDAQFTKEADRNTMSLHAEYAFDWKGLHMAAGMMAIKYSELDETKVYPGIEASYNVYRGIRAFASYNQALRLPTFTDLYYVGPTNEGNPDLKPEESSTIEGGVKYTTTAHRIQLAYFSRKGEDIIDWVKENEDDKWTPQNLTEVNAQGVEVSWELHPKTRNDNCVVSLMRVSYAFTDMDKTAENLISRYVLDNLKHKLSLTLTHDIVSKLSATWGVTWQDREGGFVLYEDGAYGAETEYDPFWMIDARLSWTEDNWKVFAEASNLTDKIVYDHGNVPQPGRWIRFGASYQLKW